MKKVTCALLTSLVLATSANAATPGQLNQHVFGAFFGVSDTNYTKENSYGVEYEYRFNETWGLGAVYEKTPDGYDDGHGHVEDFSVKIVSAYWHKDLLRLGLGVGKEKVYGDHPHTENLIRASAAYDFHLTPNLGIAPTVAIDRVDGKSIYVYGAALTLSF